MDITDPTSVKWRAGTQCISQANYEEVLHGHVRSRNGAGSIVPDYLGEGEMGLKTENPWTILANAGVVADRETPRATSVPLWYSLACKQRILAAYRRRRHRPSTTRSVANNLLAFWGVSTEGSNG